MLFVLSVAYVGGTETLLNNYLVISEATMLLRALQWY